jgi:hypothetical protein
MAFFLSIPIPIATPTPTPTPIALRQRMGSVVEVGNEPLPRGEDRRRRAGQRLLRGPRGARDQGPAGRDRGGRRLAMGLATVQYLPAMASRERIAETMRRRAMSGRRMRPGRRACPSPARAARRAVGPHLRRAAYPAAPVDQHGAHAPGFRPVVRIPLDGMLTAGQGRVDAPMISGEPILVNENLTGSADAVALVRPTLRTIRVIGETVPGRRPGFLRQSGPVAAVGEPIRPVGGQWDTGGLTFMAQCHHAT